MCHRHNNETSLPVPSEFHQEFCRGLIFIVSTDFLGPMAVSTLARFIGWLIYFSYVITENMSVILVTNSTLNQFWDYQAKLLIGLKFLKHSGSSPRFFSSGFSIASLRLSGNNPDSNDALIMLLMIGRRVPLHCFKSHVGIGSRSQYFVGLHLSIFVYQYLRVAQSWRTVQALV